MGRADKIKGRVLHNRVMACERAVLETATDKYGALTVGGNYAKLVEALNVTSQRVDKPSDIAGVIREALDTTSSGRPYLLEIVEGGLRLFTLPVKVHTEEDSPGRDGAGGAQALLLL